MQFHVYLSLFITKQLTLVCLCSEMTEKNRKDIEYVRVYYITREQAYNALSSKADIVRMDQKADRKFVNSVFDYVNSKLNKLLGESSSDEMMKAVKRLEKQIEHQNEVIKMKQLRCVLNDVCLCY